MLKNRKSLSLIAVALLSISAAAQTVQATAAPSTAAECVQAGFVWVHVQYDDVVTGACADTFSTAGEAIRSTGFTSETGYITTVDGRQSDEASQEFWAVWSQSPDAAGSFTGNWEFAQVGVDEMPLTAGQVLAFDLWPDWNEEAQPPSVDPVEGINVNPSPSASPSSSEGPTTSSEPTVTASPSVTSSPTIAASPSATSSPTLIPSAPQTSQPPNVPSSTSAPSGPGLPSTGSIK